MSDLRSKKGLAKLAALSYKLTPATLGHKVQRGAWIPAPHLMLLSAEIAPRLKAGGARIIATMPPRHGKSELLSVNTSIWHLEHWPEKKIILTSYGSELATDFGRKARDMILESEDLLSLRLKKDNLQVSRFGTTARGGMVSVGLGGAITGRGAHLLLVDDYIKNSETALSEAQREKDYDWLVTTAFTRLEPGASVIILATRWHVDDIIGRLLKEHPGVWEEFKLPAIAGENDILGRQPGEALWPERYSLEELNQIKELLGTYWFEAMYQQNPLKSMSESEIAGGLHLIDIAPARLIKVVRAWDFAASESSGDWTTGIKMGVYDSIIGRRVVILDNVRFQKSPAKTEEHVKRVAEKDGPECAIWIEQEPGSSGKIVIDHYSRNVLPEFSVKGLKPTGPLEARAQPFLAACEAGKIDMLRSDWNPIMVDEIDVFPDGDHDDQVTAASLAYDRLERARFGGVIWGRGSQPSAKSADQRIITGVMWGRS